jgi:hypothetical protein
MEQLEFDDWWKDFQSYHKNDKDNGFEEIKHLKTVVNGYLPDKRIAFINELISHNHIGLACELIPLYGNANQKQIIRDKLKHWIDSNSQDSISQIYISTILATYTEKDKEIIFQYFNEQRTRWFMIPAELYRIDKDLFLKSFEKYLLRYDDEHFYNYDGLLYLTSHLDILEFLIDNLSKHQSDRFKKFCIIKSKKPFIDKNRINGLLTLSKK